MEKCIKVPCDIVGPKIDGSGTMRYGYINEGYQPQRPSNVVDVPPEDLTPPSARTSIDKGSETMLDPKELAELDQEASMLCESLPSLWWGLYKGCKYKGFSEEQALELVKTFVRGQSDII